MSRLGESATFGYASYRFDLVFDDWIVHCWIVRCPAVAYPIVVCPIVACPIVDLLVPNFFVPQQSALLQRHAERPSMHFDWVHLPA